MRDKKAKKKYMAIVFLLVFIAHPSSRLPAPAYCVSASGLVPPLALHGTLLPNQQPYCEQEEVVDEAVTLVDEVSV